MGNTQNIPKNGTTLPILVSKVEYDNNLETFVAHFAQHINQKPTPQHCYEVIKIEILSYVNFAQRKIDKNHPFTM